MRRNSMTYVSPWLLLTNTADALRSSVPNATKLVETGEMAFSFHRLVCAQSRAIYE